MLISHGTALPGPVLPLPYETNRVVAEYADTHVGRKYVVDTSAGVTSAVTTGVGDYLKAYSTWAYAKQAFDGWAGDLRRWLEQVHGG